MTIDPTSAPFTFLGDLEVYATLVVGPVADIGVMTRRAFMRHHVQRLTVEGDRPLACPGVLTALFVLGGNLVAVDASGEVSLTPGDVLTLASGDPPVVVRVAPGGARCAVDTLLVDFARP